MLGPGVKAIDETVVNFHFEESEHFGWVCRLKIARERSRVDGFFPQSLEGANFLGMRKNKVGRGAMRLIELGLELTGICLDR